MPKYRIKGIYEMTFFVEVNTVVEADDQEEALEIVQEGISAGSAYDQDCQWANAPNIQCIEEK